MKMLFESFWDELLEGKIRDEDGNPYNPGNITPLKLLFEFQVWLDRNNRLTRK